MLTQGRKIWTLGKSNSEMLDSNSKYGTHALEVLLAFSFDEIYRQHDFSLYGKRLFSTPALWSGVFQLLPPKPAVELVAVLRLEFFLNLYRNLSRNS